MFLQDTREWVENSLLARESGKGTKKKELRVSTARHQHIRAQQENAHRKKCSQNFFVQETIHEIPSAQARSYFAVCEFGSMFKRVVDKIKGKSRFSGVISISQRNYSFV